VHTAHKGAHKVSAINDKCQLRQASNTVLGVHISHIHISSIQWVALGWLSKNQIQEKDARESAYLCQVK